MTVLIMVLVRILEGMFLAGMAGSVIVLVLTTIEDVATMLEKDTPASVDAPVPEA